MTMGAWKIENRRALVGAGEAVRATNSAPSQQHRSHALRAGSGTLMVGGKSLIIKAWRGSSDG